MDPQPTPTPQGIDRRQRGDTPADRRASPPDLMRHDTDGDGRISRDEAPQRLKERFDRLDLNGDGYIDADEVAEWRQRFRDRPGRRGNPAAGDDRDAD